MLYAISQSQEASARSDAAVNAFLFDAAEGDATYTGSLPGVSGGTQPTNPTQPTEPTQPTNPTQPTEPATPTQPTNPGGGGTPQPSPTVFSIAADSADKAEGNSGTTAYTFTVSRTGSTDASATLDYTVTGTGTNAADVTDFGLALPRGQVVIPAGQASVTLTINVRGDTTIESNESFAVTLSNPPATGTISTASGSATGTIRDDDTPPPGTTYTLTTGADRVPGTVNDDTISGTIDLTTPASNTFTDADRLNGAGGIDRFNIAVTGASGGVAIPLLDDEIPTVTNVEIFNIRNSSEQAVTFNAAAVVGEQQVWNDQSTSGTVSVTGLATGAVIGVRGNTDSVINQADATNTSFTYFQATDAVTIAVDGGIGYSTNFGSAGPDITRAQAGPAAVAINSTGATNYLGTIDLDSGTRGTITSVTINATTALNAVLSDNDYAPGATLTLTGPSAINIQRATLSGNITRIDATDSSGGVDIRASGPVDITFVGGTGNDTLRLGSSLTEVDDINGGGGIDTVEIAGGTYTAGDSPVVQGINTLRNIEQVRFTDATTINDILVADADIKLVFANFRGSDVVENADGRTYVFQDDSGNATFNGGPNSVLNLEFNRSNTTSFENIVTANGQTTINIATTGTSPPNFSGFDGINELSIASGTVVNITGANDFALNNVRFLTGSFVPADATGVTIDATGSSGRNSFLGSGGIDTIKAGSGGGNIRGQGGADDITLGTGDDTVAVGNSDTRAQTSGATTHDTVRGFSVDADRFIVDYSVTSVQQGAAFTATGGENLVTAIGNAINAGSNGTGLAVNAAAVITLTGPTNAGTYLVLNDSAPGTAGYTVEDSVIKLVGSDGTLGIMNFSFND